MPIKTALPGKRSTGARKTRACFPFWFLFEKIRLGFYAAL